MTNLRANARQDLAVRMLRDLDVAMARYRRATGVYPSDRGETSRISVVVDLLDHPKTRPIIEKFPRFLRRGPNNTQLVDPWGTPLMFIGADSNDPKVIANDGRPVFVSAGPDRDFGEHTASGLGDNLRSDDPGPEGFRIDDIPKILVKDEKKGTTREEDD